MNTKGMKFLAVLAVLALAFTFISFTSDVNLASAEETANEAIIVETETEYATVEEAFTAATTGQTVKVLISSEIGAITIGDGRSIILDLNDCDLTSSATTTFKVTNGSLIVTDTGEEGSGSISVSGEAFRVEGQESDSALALGAIEVESAGDCCIFFKGPESGTGTAVTIACSGTTLTTNGGYATVQGNGLCGNETLIFNGCTITCTTENHSAIYVPNNGSITLTDCTVSGVCSAIEIRAGTLEIVGGSYKATADNYSVVSNHNGGTTTGAAIAIAQHTTQHNIDVSITDEVTMTGVYAISLANPEENTGSETLTLTLGDVACNGNVLFGDTRFAVTLSEDASIVMEKGAILNGTVSYTVDDETSSVVLDTLTAGTDGVTIGTGSITIDGQIASGSVTVTGTVEISGSVEGDGPLNITLSDDATLIVPVTGTLDVTGIVFDSPDEGTAEFKILGGLTGTASDDNDFANTTVTATDPEAAAEILDIEVGVEGVTTEDELRAVLEIYTNITLGADITITEEDDLDFISKVIDLDGFTLTIDANITFTVKETKINGDGGYISIQNGVLVNNQSDIYCMVDIGDDGSVDNSKAKVQESSGSSFSEDLQIGYGNIAKLSNFTISANTSAIIFGTAIFDGSNKIMNGAAVEVYGSVEINGTLTVAGSFFDYGEVVLNGTMNVNGTSSGNAGVIIEPTSASGTVAWTDDYDSDYAAFLISSGATLNIQKPTVESYKNVLAIGVKGYNVLRVDGTLAISGTLVAYTAGNATTGAHITDNGTITINGTAFAADATMGTVVPAIDLLNGVTITATSVTGTIYVTDYYVCDVESAGLDDTKKGISDGNRITLTNVKGVVIQENMTTKFDSKNVKYFFANLAVTGAMANVDKSKHDASVVFDGTMTPQTVDSTTYYGSIAIAGDITVGEKVTVTFNSGKDLRVNSDATLTVLAKNDSMSLAKGATLTVSGMIKTYGKESVVFTVNGTIKAAYYEITDSEAVTTKYWTTFDKAIATIADTDDKTIIAYGKITSSSDFTLLKDQFIILNDEVTVKGTSVIEEGASVSGAGNFKVTGMLTFEDISSYSATGNNSKVKADVEFDNDPRFIYTSLANAVAIPGVTEVELNQDVTLRSDLTIPAGVTVSSGKYSITVVEGKVMTVDGGVILTKGTINLTNSTVATTAPASLIVNGFVIVSDEEASATDYLGLEYVSGAHFTMKYNGVYRDYITSVEYAAENFVGGNDATYGTVTIKGIVSAGSVEFDKSSSYEYLNVKVDKYAVWKWKESDGKFTANPADSYLTMGIMALDGAKLTIVDNSGDNSKDGFMTGTVAASVNGETSAVILVNATGLTFESASTETSTGIEEYLYMQGTQTGSVDIAAGTVTLDGAYTTSDAVGEVFVVDEGATLVITKGYTFTAKGYYVTVAGTVQVDTNNSTLTQTGGMTVSGIINVEDLAVLDVNGTLYLVDDGAIVIDDTLGKEAAFNLSGTLAVGDKLDSLNGSATVTGTVNLDKESAYVKVYPGATVEDIVYGGSSTNIAMATFYVNGVAYMDVYALSGKVDAYTVIGGEVFDLDGLDCGIYDETAKIYTGLYAKNTAGTKSACWYTDDSYAENTLITITTASTTGTKISSTNTEFYGSASLAVVYGTVTVGTGIDLYIDGKNYEPRSYYGNQDYFSVGTHSVYVQYQTGYEGDNVTIKFNGTIVPVTATGGTFTITSDMLTFTLVADGAEPYTPEPTPEPTPVEEKEWTITTILLLVLVILIAIMAVIVALRLNRN